MSNQYLIQMYGTIGIWTSDLPILSWWFVLKELVVFLFVNGI